MSETEGPVIVEKKSDKTIDGVGVLTFPEGIEYFGENSQDLAIRMASEIRKGTILMLPNTRDYLGNLLWDFRIEGGDPGQVRIERGQADVPTRSATRA